MSKPSGPVAPFYGPTCMIGLSYSFWGLCLLTPTGALLLDPAGGHRPPDSVPFVTGEWFVALGIDAPAQA